MEAHVAIRPVTAAPLHALLYQSTATRACSAADLERIGATARRNNAARDVTGLLLYGEISMLPGMPGQFLQWLEGPEADVEATYDRICRDTRHSDVRLTARGPSSSVAGVDGRLFPTWDMSVRRLADLPATLFGFLELARTLPPVLNGSS